MHDTKNDKNNYTLMLVFLAMMMALTIILTRFVSIPIGNTFRIGLGRLPVFASSMWFGPISGLVVATGADIIGAVLTTGWNPVLTIPAALAGLLPGLLAKIFRLRKREHNRSAWICIRTILCVAISHVATSGILMSFFLNYFYPSSLLLLLGMRTLIALGEGVVQGILLYLIETRVHHED